MSQLWVEGSFPHADENGSSHSPKGENEPSFQSYSQESRDSLWFVTAEPSGQGDGNHWMSQLQDLPWEQDTSPLSANPQHFYSFISPPLLPHTPYSSKETFSSLVWEMEEGNPLSQSSQIFCLCLQILSRPLQIPKILGFWKQKPESSLFLCFTVAYPSSVTRITWYLIFPFLKSKELESLAII